MKVDTEWRLGVLAFICNVLACTVIIFTMLIGVTVGDINTDVVWCLFAVYLVTLITLFHFWVDKFNYIED
jgi:hypothetical protein